MNFEEHLSNMTDDEATEMLRYIGISDDIIKAAREQVEAERAEELLRLVRIISDKIKTQ